MEELRQLTPEQQTEEAAQQLISVPNEARWVGFVLIILVIGLVFALVLRKLKKDDDDPLYEETRESVFSEALFKAQLQQLWPSWLRNKNDGALAWFNPFFSLQGEPDTRRIIRQAYQSLLAAAQDRDLSRPQGKTPAEYEQTLTAVLPDEQEALHLITERYIQARYDREPPTHEAAEEVAQTWEQLRSTFDQRNWNEIERLRD